jgi:hypothetical protein
MSDKHVYYCTVYYTTKHKRFLRKPIEINHSEELGYMYGTQEEVIERVQKLTHIGTINVLVNLSWTDEEIIKSDGVLRTLDGKCTFEELKNNLKSEDFISYCKDNLLPLEMILK